jgi:Flp pilus assembly protein CpaB
MSSVPPPGFPTGGLGAPPSGPIPAGSPMPGLPLSGSAPTSSGAGARRGKPARAEKVKAPTRRVIGLQRALAILLAVVAVAVFAFAGLDQSAPDAYVLRAAVSVAEMNEITPDMIEIAAADLRYVDDGAISGQDLAALEAEAAALVGQVARYPIARGQQLRSGMFTGPTGELRALASDERLVSIPASLANAVAGSLRPGDRVDVVAVERRDGISGVIALDVEIVAVRLDADQLYSLSGEQVGPEGRELRPDQLQPTEPIPGMYTLRIPVTMMPLFAVASSQGEFHLFYRGSGAADLMVPSVSLIEQLCLATLDEMRPQACLEYAAGLDPFASGLFGPIDGEQGGDPVDTNGQ